MDKKPTGSQKLLTNLIQQGSAASAEDVKAALAVTAASDLKLLRWQIRGIPATYLELESTFQTPVEKLNDALSHFVASAGIKNINILIHGIPKPDISVITAVVVHADPKAMG